MEAVMATLTQNYRPTALRITFVNKRDALIERLLPRRRTVVSVGMILAGMGIPALMAFKILPLSLLLGLVGLALVGIGGVLVLVYSGEL
jgi:hypothetical protein